VVVEEGQVEEQEILVDLVEVELLLADLQHKHHLVEVLDTDLLADLVLLLAVAVAVVQEVWDQIPHLQQYLVLVDLVDPVLFLDHQ
jgi:hypothetical protein